MSNNLPATTNGAEIMDAVITKGDLGALTPNERVVYYKRVCESIGLNPLTKPFDYLELNNGLTLYATRTATDQLRTIHGVSVRLVRAEEVDGIYIVTAEATDRHGRTDQATGAVPLVKENGEWKTAKSGKRYFAPDGTFAPLGPLDRANAIMKCETKAKRRVTLSICGLGWLDESEVESVPRAHTVTVDDDGVIQEPAQTPQIAPGATEPRSAWEKTLQAAERCHIDEDSLAEYFAMRGYDDMHVPDDILTKFARWCGSNSVAKVQEHVRSVIAENQPAPEPQPGMDADDYAQVTASIAAEEAQARATGGAGDDRYTN